MKIDIDTAVSEDIQITDGDQYLGLIEIAECGHWVFRPCKGVDVFGSCQLDKISTILIAVNS